MHWAMPFDGKPPKNSVKNKIHPKVKSLILGRVLWLNQTG
ncbi:hypothetical protein AO366_0468 [Moraxella catarrhalis]|nr:hypothetical protein AO378_1349 [Moraxella catarrhalis]OAV13718.1 hypothetical protein AO376_1476 [Moraxella catarrhalis]OAV20574.1 hypothetical protein AO374_0447 [Moraxella catarrhalis]OAV28636.1 hypothetical protein AO369_0556 [Moraxella catarrhalis]OAV35042.1 hypothetical protein AO366_0468 [Moraxella catarrhalis]